MEKDVHIDIDYDEIIKNGPEEPFRIWGSIVGIKPAKTSVFNQDRLSCCTR